MTPLPAAPPAAIPRTEDAAEEGDEDARLFSPRSELDTSPHNSPMGLKTPSPRLVKEPSSTTTAETEGMSPFPDTPLQTNDVPLVLATSCVATPTAIHPHNSRSSTPSMIRLDDGGYRRGSSPENERWESRALFPDDSSPEHERRRIPPQERSIRGMPERSQFGQHVSISDTPLPSGETSQGTHRRKKSKDSPLGSSRPPLERNESWNSAISSTETFGIQERRRSNFLRNSARMSSGSNNSLTLPHPVTPDTSCCSASPEISPTQCKETVSWVNDKDHRTTATVTTTTKRRGNGVGRLKNFSDSAVLSSMESLYLRIKRFKMNELIFLLCFMGLASLYLTVSTATSNQIVTDSPQGKEPTKESIMNLPILPSRPDHRLPQNGLRGGIVKQALQKAKEKDKEKHEHAHRKKKDKHDAEKATSSKTNAKKLSSKTKHKLVLSVAKPKGSIEIQSSKFSDVDPNMYNRKENYKPDHPAPRTISLHESISPIHQPREVTVFPAAFTDNTQFYGVADSDDERLSKMELREPHEQGECVPMQEWQSTFHPWCNGMHELGLEEIGRDTGEDALLFGTNGYWRHAWKLDLLGGNTRMEDRETVVLKTLKPNHNFEDAHEEHDRIDSIAMERLTSSPHVINLYGFCGHSVITEFADGKRVGELADKSKKTPLARLKIARDIASGLADVHGIDGDGNATLVHLDINPTNVVSVGGTLKLNDFNIGHLRKWNTTSNTPCGFRNSQYPNPQWRSPEEARNELLTEKVDVFSMGHILFRLICGHEPWNKLEPDGKPRKEEINSKVLNGVLPFIPDFVKDTEDEEVIAIREAMLHCYTYDPVKRLSAREIANSLENALAKLSVSAAVA